MPKHKIIYKILFLIFMCAVSTILAQDEPQPPPLSTPLPTPPRPMTAPLTISGGVINRKASNLVVPKYPATLFNAGIGGLVNVQVLVNEQGDVIKAEAVSGHPLLRQLAIDAARASKFNQTLLSGKPVKLSGSIVYNFSNGEELMPPPELIVETGHSTGISSLWLAPDGKTLVSMSDDRVIIRNIDTERTLQTIENAIVKDHTPDGKILLIQNGNLESDNFTAWEIKTGNKLYDISGEKDCNLSINDKFLVCKKGEQIFTVRNPQSGEVLREIKVTEGAGNNFALGFDDKIIYSNLKDGEYEKGGSLHIWNAETNQTEFTVPGVSSWGVNYDGTLLFAEDAQKTLKVYDLTASNNLILTEPNIYRWNISDTGKFLQISRGNENTTTYEVRETRTGTIKLSEEVYFISNNLVRRAKEKGKPGFYDLENETAVNVPDDWYYFSELEDKGLILLKGERETTLLNIKTQKPLFTLKAVFKSIENLSADNKILTALTEKDGKQSLTLWNTETGAGKTLYDFPQAAIGLGNPSPFMPRLRGSLTLGVTLIKDNKWERSWKHGNSLFVPSKNLFVYGAPDGDVIFWNAETSEKLKSLVKHTEKVEASFSADGVNLEILNDQNITKSFNLETGDFNVRKNAPERETADKYEVEFNDETKEMILKNARTKTILHRAAKVEYYEMSDDEKRFAFIRKVPLKEDKEDEQLEVFDIASKKIIFSRSNVNTQNTLGFNNVRSLFSPDGRLVAVYTTVYTEDFMDSVYKLEVLNSADGKPVFAKNEVSSFAFDDEWKNLLVRNYPGKARADGDFSLYSVNQNGIKETNKEKFSESPSYNGEYLDTLDLTGYILNLSSNGNFVALESYRAKDFILWNIETQDFSRIEAHASYITNVALSPDNRYVISSSEDGTVKFRQTLDNEAVLTLILLDEDFWVVTTPDGRFDTNKSLDDIRGLEWSLAADDASARLPLEAFMRQFYEPDLLQRVLKCRRSETCENEFRLLPPLNRINRVQPKVAVREIKSVEGAADLVDVTIEIENVTQSVSISATDKTKRKQLTSGAYDLRLFRDGQLVGNSSPQDLLEKYTKDAPQLAEEDRAAKSLINNEEDKAWRTANDLSKVVKFVNGKAVYTFKNIKLPKDGRDSIEFSAYAFNADRVKSDTARAKFPIPASLQNSKIKGRAFVIAFGVNKYQSPAWDLQFAANDARAMNVILSDRLRKTNSYEELVEIPLVSDDEVLNGQTIKKRDATKVNVQTVLELLAGRTPTVARLKILTDALGAETVGKIKQANPEDAIFFSFSSHGYADRNGIFYILPTDIGANMPRTVTPQLLANSISSDELSLWLREVDAGEMMMIVDACNSEAAVKNSEFKPAPMGSRGLGQLAYDKGMKILTATQTANSAIEAGGKIGHGLLTYALLREGIEQARADFRAADKNINLKEWLQYAEFRVPGLYDDLAHGKLKGIGRDIEVIILDGEGGTQKKASLQQPTLFDFNRKQKEFSLIRLP